MSFKFAINNANAMNQSFWDSEQSFDTREAAEAALMVELDRIFPGKWRRYGEHQFVFIDNDLPGDFAAGYVFRSSIDF